MRRQAREIALQILFQTEFSSQLSVDDILRMTGHTKDPSIKQYATELVQGVTENKSKIDPKIQEASRNWKLDRMAAVDRNLLRIATYEMLFASEIIEPKIAINEAIEISKIYGNQESSAFVNGILDQVVRNERR